MEKSYTAGLVGAVLVCVVLGGPLGCCSSSHRPTGGKIVSDKLPPTFKFTGTGSRLEFHLLGPWPDLQSMQKRNPVWPEIWRIEAFGRILDDETSQSPPIQYGVMPAGYQPFNSSAPNPHDPYPAPALQMGKFYMAVGSEMHTRDVLWQDRQSADLCFQVGATNVTQVPCTATP